MKAEVRTVTPSIAKAWLARNESNRSLRPARIKQYANDMKSGKWHLTGQGITFGKDGNLLDGQHRLNAIIMADVPVEMLVVTDAEICGDYDGNLVRTSVDKFKLIGKPSGGLYSTNGLSIVRLAYLISMFNCTNVRYNPSFEELSVYIDNNFDDINWIVSICVSGGHSSSKTGLKGLRRGIIGASLYSIYKVSELSRFDIEHIVNILRSGLSESEYDAPIIAMRNKLLVTIGGGTDVNKELFLRIQFMCKQIIDKRTTFRNVMPKENLFKFN